MINRHKYSRIYFIIVFLFCILFTSFVVQANTLKFSKNVKENKVRNQVQHVQILLIENGYDPGLADGYNGNPKNRS